MKIGNLVKLKKHCKGSGKLALLVELNGNYAKIVFAGTGETITALPSNLVFVSG